MPDGSGEYVLRRLKENVVTRDIPVIVVTGTRDRMVERMMCNLGAARFFTKPVAWDDLWAELQRHIRLIEQVPLAWVAAAMIPQLEWLTEQRCARVAFR